MSPPAQEDSPDCDTQSSANLQFPTIPVSGTPASWFSQSQLVQSRLTSAKMASQHDADSSCDEATSSLGDSTYDFIDDKSTTTDDEEVDRMTESTSSDSFEADRPVVVPAPQHAPSHMQTGTEDADLDDSPLSVKTPTYSEGRHNAPGSTKVISREQSLAEDPDEPIEFEEPSVTNLNTSRFTEVSYTLRIIEQPHQVTGELQDVVKGLPTGKINVTVRQTMTSQSIDLKGKPYKILVVGNRSMKEPIIQKIGGALAANLRSSIPEPDDARPTKFNIVPVSAFGDSGHPDVVLIDSSGLEMSVEDCTSAGYVRTQDGRDTLSLRMANGSHIQSWWIGSKYVLSNDWILPDLAIFCTSEEEAYSSKQTRAFARSFMNRHDVPSIVIQKQATWDRHTDKATLATLNYLTPHLCLEYQQTNRYNYLFKKRYPIDLATFLSIDAGQLNRNLACLATSKQLNEPRVKTQAKDGEPGDSVWYSDAVDAFREVGRRIFPKDVASVLPLLIVILLSIVPLMLWSSFSSTSSLSCTELRSTGASISSATSPMIPIATTQISLSSTSTLVASSTSSTPSQMPSSKSLSSNTDIASFLMDAYTLGPNKSDKFMVQILGDRHIVVNSPRWFRKTKKAPTLLFKVSRQNLTIEYALSTLGEGVYALQIPHEEAIGMLNVSMTIHSKVDQHERFEVDFGSSWLKTAAWKRATRAMSEQMQKDISLVQTGLTIVYNQTKAELSTFVQQTKTKIVTQRKPKDALLATHFKWGTQTRDLILVQMKDLSRNLSRRLQVGQKRVSQQIQSLTTDVTRSISIFTRTRTHTISHRAQHLARLISRLKASGPGRAGDRLKNAQKKALRSWWKIVGVPKTSRLPRMRQNSEPQEEEEEVVHACFG